MNPVDICHTCLFIRTAPPTGGLGTPTYPPEGHGAEVSSRSRPIVFLSAITKRSGGISTSKQSAAVIYLDGAR